jgi:hypothetical protein
LASVSKKRNSKKFFQGWLDQTIIYRDPVEAVDDRSIMGSFLSTPQPHAAVSFEIGGNFKPDENSVLIVGVPDTKSNFNYNQSRFCKITPEICR